MDIIPLTAFLDPPCRTASLPGIGGRLKVEPEDFEVDEIPAYAPSGEGEHLFVRIEKRDLAGDWCMGLIARALDISKGEIGTAGIKDRRAIARQWISVPAGCREKVDALDIPGLTVLETALHGNKLRPGHLNGNRFRILIRDCHADTATLAPPILERIRAEGMANFYGSQRFGNRDSTLAIGLAILGKAEHPRYPDGNKMNIRNPFLKKFALSAVQSAMFNGMLMQRIELGDFRRILSGDVLTHWPAGGIFRAEDVAVEQERFDRRDLVHAGPMFGRKTFPAADVAAVREEAFLASVGFTKAEFSGYGKLLSGTRRHNLIYLDGFDWQMEPEGLRVSFALPAGSYATVLLRELMKSAGADDRDPPTERRGEPEDAPTEGEGSGEEEAI